LVKEENEAKTIKHQEGILVQKVKTRQRQLQHYNGLVSSEALSEIGRLANGLKGLHVIHVNATPWGGGVAEVLDPLVPLLRSVGIDAEWYVIPLHESFIGVTKSLHHCLQGYPDGLTPEQMEVYLNNNQKAALELKGKSLTADLWVIHDPQALPLVNFLPDTSRAIWSCHLDTTEPSSSVRDILMPFINRYHRVIFSLEQYVLEGLSWDKVYISPPAIDPLSPKNLSLPRTTAKQILSQLGIAPDRPLLTQVSRFDRWKDPWGVIDAYRMARRDIPNLQLALVGVLSAQDDPDARDVLHSVQEYAADDPDIHLFYDPSQVADREVNAFQTASDVVVQKSIREGFGLTVAEAMWKGTPVVGGNCGGIRLQIRNGETGFLVGSPEECADRIIALLRDSDLARRIGQAGSESVRHHFLMPRLLRDHLSIYASLMTAESRVGQECRIMAEPSPAPLSSPIR
jgi:trehalose synthase